MPTPKLPAALSLAGHTLTIKETPDNECRDGGDNKLHGDYDYFTGTIRVAAGQGPAQKGETILHEALHAAASFYDLGLGDDEERVVQVFANAMFQVVRQNPAFIRYLQRG